MHRCERIVVSYDPSGVGWTGGRTRFEESLDRVRRLDHDGRCIFLPDRVSETPGSGIERDTLQRQRALDVAAEYGDWVFQIDTDEFLPSVDALLNAALSGIERGAEAVEWPMSVLYRRTSQLEYLQVVGPSGQTHVEYPGAVLVRAGVKLTEARRPAARILRCLPNFDAEGQQLRHEDETLILASIVERGEVILHNSWARSASVVWRKVLSWGHGDGISGAKYFATTWLPSPITWRFMRNFHPFNPGLWPRLSPTTLEPLLNRRNS